MAACIDATTVGGFIAARGRRVAMRAGEPLFFEGDRSMSVYSCIAGRIRLFVSTEAGREMLIGFKHPGEQFGELSAITSRPRMSSAVTVEDSIVAHMPGERFLDQLEHEPALALAVLRSLAEQLRTTSARLLARNAESAGARTGHKLVELASLRARHQRENATRDVRLDITQTELANWIGTSRESVSRALGEFRRRGAIETGRCHITVLDVDQLVGIAETL
jgi:CRP-like cAMP-binding protein